MTNTEINTKGNGTQLLAEENEKLRREEKMLRLLCDTSSSAFIYYNFRENRVDTLGNWDHFFDFSISSMEDLSRLYDRVEEQYEIPLREGMFIESQKRERESFEIKLKESRICIEVEVNVVYDPEGEPTDKIIRFKDVTKLTAQKD